LKSDALIKEVHLRRSSQKVIGMETGNEYEPGSLSLGGAVAMGTGVMIGAGIFALTGQVAEFSGALYPLAFLLAAIISGFSAYTYIKVSNKYAERLIELGNQ
jgi:amino acid transporter